MSRTTDKMTYVDGQYFCNVCDDSYEGEEQAEACHDSHKRMRVLYTVQFECDVILEDGDDFQDAVSNIDIPEGGDNNSVYCENTFEVHAVYDRDKEGA